MATLDHPAKRTRPLPEGAAAGWLNGTVSSVVVGASFPVSAALEDFPFALGQSLRYLLGALILIVIARGRLVRPRPGELVRLAAVAAVGMAGFNFFLLAAVGEIGGANTSVIVSLSTLLLALTAATRRLLTSAAVVVAGAALATGTDGGTSALGLALAVGTLLCETGFTLLAVPLIPRLGPLNIAVWGSLLATVPLGVVGLTVEGATMPTGTEAAALLYLGAGTTALAFVTWFSAVRTLGAERAGLLVGLMPVAGLAVEAVIEGTVPSAPKLAGVALVAAGVAFGSRRKTRDFSARAMQRTAPVG